jgi:hypothetical protein
MAADLQVKVGERAPMAAAIDGVLEVQTRIDPARIFGGVTVHADEPAHPHGWGHLVRRFRSLWARR